MKRPNGREQTPRSLCSRRASNVTIAVIAERRYLKQLMPMAMIRAFAARAMAADVLCPQGGRFDPRSGLFHADDGSCFDLNRYDAVVSRNRNGLGLAMLSYAEAAGALTINRPSAILPVRNKAEMAIALERAGIPCPPTVLAEHHAVLATLSGEWFPLILKATYGDNSQGLRVIRQPEDLADIHWDDDPVLAQKFLPNDGFDLKLYVYGDKVFAVRKPSPISADGKATAQRIEPNRPMIELALKAGRLFGLDIFGVDVIENQDGLHVVEVNDFPNFTGIGGIGDLLVDYILDRPGRARADRELARVSTCGGGD